MEVQGMLEAQMAMISIALDSADLPPQKRENYKKLNHVLSNAYHHIMVLAEKHRSLSFLYHQLVKNEQSKNVIISDLVSL